VRSSLPNPKGEIESARAFVRVKVYGFTRPHSLVIPQDQCKAESARLVRLGRRRESKASIRPVTVGDWMGDQWLVTGGLKEARMWLSMA